MRILYVVPYAPTRIRTRPYNLLRNLVKRGHSLTLASLWTDVQEREALEDHAQSGVRVISARLPALRAAWNCAFALLGAVPIQAMYCWHPMLAKQIREAIGIVDFEIIHVEHLRGARYGLDILDRKVTAPRPPIIWDSVDCISSLFEKAAAHSKRPISRAVTRFELPRTRKYEARLTERFDRTLVVSDAEKKAFEQIISPRQSGKPIGGFQGKCPSVSKIGTLRNGVDLSFFSPSTVERAPRTLVMSGKMSYHANGTAAQYLLEEIMPLVWGEIPDAIVQIAGQNPPAQLKRLAARSFNRVKITGTVADLRPYIQSATMAVAPMTYGAGIQNKLLEAMATSTPVIATPNALEGLAAQPERDILVGTDPASFARQVVRLVRDPGLGKKIGSNGRHYVELNHDWGQVANELESIYHQVRSEQRLEP